MCLTYRDSEDSAPAEYPPDQPEADALDDDEQAYGAEEAELQAALERELEDAEITTTKPRKAGEDHEMGDTDETVRTKEEEEDDDASDAGSEDLEAESSESEDEEDEEEGEGEGDEDMEMADGDDKPADPKTETQASGGQKPVARQQGQPEVMVH